VQVIALLAVEVEVPLEDLDGVPALHESLSDREAGQPASSDQHVQWSGHAVLPTFSQ
jgi:hypothetical protein